MSEEVAMAIADAAELARLRRWASRWKGTAKLLRGRLQHQTRRRIYWRTRYHEAIVARDQLARELVQARERERTQLVDAQTALRTAMEQAEATQRELMRLRGDDGHGKPYLNEA